MNWGDDWVEYLENKDQSCKRAASSGVQKEANSLGDRQRNKLRKNLPMKIGEES